MKANVKMTYKGFTSKLYFSSEYWADYPYHGNINFPPGGGIDTQSTGFRGRTMSECVRDFEEKIDKWLKENNIQPNEEGDYGKY